jgi:hypothetical protein
VLGLKLVTNLPLLRFYHFRENVPSGDLIVTCTTTNKSPPKLGELGKGLRCELTYFTRDELAEVVASLNA